MHGRRRWRSASVDGRPTKRRRRRSAAGTHPHPHPSDGAPAEGAEGVEGATLRHPSDGAPAEGAEGVDGAVDVDAVVRQVVGAVKHDDAPEKPDYLWTLLPYNPSLQPDLDAAWANDTLPIDMATSPARALSACEYDDLMDTLLDAKVHF